jgi:hypothetical protein
MLNFGKIANALVELRISSPLPRCSQVSGNSEVIRELPVKVLF